MALHEFVIRRRIELDAAHRVPDHGSQCRRIHGHRYVVHAVCKGPLHISGEQTGMVVDFGFIKDVMMRHIHQPCDHGIIVYEKDYALIRMLGVTPDTPEDRYPDILKIQWLPTAPTAENLAEFWFNCMKDDVSRLSKGLGRLVGVEVQETPNCIATFAVENY